MIKEKASIDFIAKVTGLSKEEIEALKWKNISQFFYYMCSICIEKYKNSNEFWNKKHKMYNHIL